MSDSSASSNNGANGGNLSMLLEHGIDRRDSCDDNSDPGISNRGTHIFNTMAISK